MNKKLISVLFVILFLSFVGIMDYPYIARLLNDRKQTAVTVEYQNTSAQLGKKEKAEYVEQVTAYNQSLETGAVMDLEVPFTGSELQDKKSGNDIIGIIDIPKIDLTLPVYHGTSEEVLEKGAGHLPGSSYPVGGESTHACIAAHRGLPNKKLFTNLDQIEEGDLFYLDVLGEKLAYQVYEVEVVTPDYMETLVVKEGEDLVTLITCTPYGINTHRIYVRGTRVPYEDIKEQEQDHKSKNFWQNWWWIIVSVILLIWMVFLLKWFHYKPAEEDHT